MQPEPNAFPTKDTEFTLVGYTDNDKYRSFDISQEYQQDDTELQKLIPVDIDTLNPSSSFYQGPIRLNDRFASDPPPMATFQWRNHSKSDVTGYIAVYYLKRELAKGMLKAIEIWETEQPHSQYKVGIEVKAVFKKLHMHRLDPFHHEDIPLRRVMFINRILNKIIQAPATQEDLKQLGSLISAVEWQLFDTNYTRDSAHVLDTVLEFRVHIYRAQMFRAGGSYFKLPTRLAYSHAVINPNNTDNLCFYYAVCLGLMDLEKLKTNTTKIGTIRKQISEQGINIAMTLQCPVAPTATNFKQFELENPGIQLNVFTPTPDEASVPITTLYIGMNKTGREVNILFAKDIDGNTHYAYIRDLSKLLFSANKHKGKKYVCKICVCTYFCSQQALERHMDKKHPFLKHKFVCKKCMYIARCQEELAFHDLMCTIRDKNLRPVTFPDKPFQISWKAEDNFKLTQIPTYLVADFECVLDKIDEVKGEKTHLIHRHLPCAWVIVVQTIYPFAPFNRVYRRIGENPEDTMESFCETLLDISKQVKAFMDRLIPMHELTQKQKTDYENERHCYICGDPLDVKGRPAKAKVRDHDHSTGKYLGAACSECNLKRQARRYFLPLIFHNAKGYDMHPLLKEITKQRYACTFEGIPNSSEKFLTLTIIPPYQFYKPIKILDSMQFMPGSLSSLVENQKKELKAMTESFPQFSRFFFNQGYSYQQAQMLLKKNEFPYEWLDSFGKISRPISELPLKDRTIVDTLGIKTVAEYLDIYLCCDGTQLADCFEAYCQHIRETHKVEPKFFLGGPSTSYAAMLYMMRDSPVKPVALSDANMVGFFQSMVRGGQAYICTRYCQARPGYRIVYLDATNLYGYAMCQNLPTHDFQWMPIAELELFKKDPCLYINELLQKGECCAIMGDFHIPREIHRMTWDYPFMPEKARVPEEWLSDTQRWLNEQAGATHNAKQEYLLQTMLDKKDYFVYGEILAFYLSHGVEMTEVVCGIKFKVSKWLEPYIMLNTRLRDECRAKGQTVGVTVFKGMNNVIFGKNMQNDFKLTTLKIVNNIKDAIKTQSLPGFVRNVFCSDRITIADVKHEEIYFNKPIYLGGTITELAKLHMYQFYYDMVIPHWGRENVKLLMTDTDSLMLEIKTDDFWKDVEVFNRANNGWIQAEGNPRNNQLGVFKSETGNDPIVEFVGLRAKMYSYITESDQMEHMKAKGIPKAALEQYSQEDFVQVLDGGQATTVSMQSIRSYQHQLFTVEMFKRGLSCNDVKRWICPNNIDTQPYGYNPITPEEEAAKAAEEAERRRQEIEAEEAAWEAHWEEYEKDRMTPDYMWDN